jgi:hypothetical protein
MSKISLIIPDVHLKWQRAEKIIASVGADEVIFLGDYFDAWDDTPEMVRDTCEWLEESVKKPNRRHLIGNHDQHYAFPYKTFRCSGYAQWKDFIIRDSMSPDVWKKLKWYEILDNRWLLTHAGLHKANVPEEIRALNGDRAKMLEKLAFYLENEIVTGFRAGAEGVGSWIFNAGQARGGYQKYGGITWCDYTMEFNPFKGLNQLMGHTANSKPEVWHWTRINEKGDRVHPSYDAWGPTVEQLDNPKLSANICLDVFLNTHWAVWNGKTLEIGCYNSL